MVKIFSSINRIRLRCPARNRWINCLHRCSLLIFAMSVSEWHLFLLKALILKCFFTIHLIEGLEIVISWAIRHTERAAVLRIHSRTILILVVVVTDRLLPRPGRSFSLPRSLNRWIVRYTTLLDTSRRSEISRAERPFCEMIWLKNGEWTVLPFYKIIN